MSAKRITIRLSEPEWNALDKAAGGRPVSTYAREKLLGNSARKRKVTRRPKQDHVLLAQILATLGRSELPKSMRELADAALSGTVPDSRDVLLSLRAACLTIEKMRHDLTEALGIKPE
tara:strand:- start:29052 stop:29405 length:354 start_codon:yes stop_codon:yes gene_type:complete